jgi:diguanylate cyclase (GGDEF)-like protein
MAYLAQHDALTNLPNRIVLNDRISQAMKVSRRHRSQFAVLYIDLDNFKNINDSYSHAVGDSLLKEVAARLKYCVRDSDTVSRVGGDEFIILLTDFDDMLDVTRIGKKILTALSTPYIFSRRKYHATASIGVSIYPDNGSDAADMINHADAAMYQAKRLGGNKLQFIELAQVH